MKDQLSFYQINADQLDALPQRDFLVDRELTGFFERQGSFIDDLWFDAGIAIGEILPGISSILGGHVDSLMGRSGNLIQPSGPTIYTTHIPQGDLVMILKSLGQARRALRGHTDSVNDAQHQRLEQLAQGHPGGSAKLAGHVHQIQRFVEKGRGKAELMSVYVRWGKR